MSTAAEALRMEITSFREEMVATREAMLNVRTDVAGLQAELRAAKDRYSAEIGVLFAKADDQEKRISAIETTYWPRPAQERFEDRVTREMAETRRQHTDDSEALEQKIAALSWTLGKMVGATGVVVIAAQAALKFFGQG